MNMCVSVDLRISKSDVTCLTDSPLTITILAAVLTSADVHGGSLALQLDGVSMINFIFYKKVNYSYIDSCYNLFNECSSKPINNCDRSTMVRWTIVPQSMWPTVPRIAVLKIKIAKKILYYLLLC